MLSSVSKRMTYANITATLALVFAMSGGALAANKYLITSKKQIKPTVLASLKGAKGAPGAQGPAGLQGAAGAAGKEGPAGKDGKEGPAGKEGLVGKEGPEGIEGPEGKEGSPWTAGGTLPSGKTETGTFAITSETGSGVVEGTKLAAGNISFAIPLSVPLVGGHVIYVNQSVPSECENSAHPGSASADNPEAAAGYLCVYQGIKRAVTAEMEIVQPSSFSPGAGVSGALLLQEAAEAGALSAGTWAVTAP